MVKMNALMSKKKERKKKRKEKKEKGFIILNNMKTLLFESLELKRGFCNIYLKSLFAHKVWIYLIKNTAKWNCYCNLNILNKWCKAEFVASLPQSSVSHDPSEIILTCWFDDQETFLTIMNVKNNCAPSYFSGNQDLRFKILYVTGWANNFVTFLSLLTPNFWMVV